MTGIDDYPADYRDREVRQIMSWICRGECAAVVGLSGSGKSNLISFVDKNPGVGSNCPKMVLIDCNRLSSPNPASFFGMIYQRINPDSDPVAMPVQDWLILLEGEIRNRLNSTPGICLLLDRFDAVYEWTDFPNISNNLRSLRDQFKYRLTYLITGRKPIDEKTELAELFFGHTLWLGPLVKRDAAWSARRDLERMTGKQANEWSEEEIDNLISLSGGYPSFLRAVCEAYAGGVAADLESMSEYPSVTRLLAEFWSGKPTQLDLEQFGLESVPLFVRPNQTKVGPQQFDRTNLTAKEDSLLNYLMQHADSVCEKDDLIRAVWPEDVIIDRGVRDESLAQLVRRLRVKIEANPAIPSYIQTVPGRGYLFHF